ncbi:tail fiber protein [Flavobacterium sp. 17A]|uniref:Tail fiber protein n=2 Tax=Flavobacterium potami TaxID=2872310 RepID=A0A9X1HE23_9FLAO|nr:tail fiber protein [Flavobacterium potami]
MFVLFLCTKLIYAQNQPYIGEVRIFAGNYAPIGWAICDGSLLNISGNEALYTLLGTTYGGDGQTTFALPDFRGRAGIGFSGTSPLGTKDGSENVVLSISNLPPHTHSGNIKVSSAKATVTTPVANSSIASPSITVNGVTRDVLGYNDKTPNTTLAPINTSLNGGSLPINVMQPYLVVNYIIALEGIFPSSN